MKKLLQTILFSLIILSCSMAQSAIQVYLYDIAEERAVDAQSVLLVHQPTGLEITGLTNKKGTYTFKNVKSLNGYDIIVPESPGYFETKVEDINLRSEEEKYIQVNMVSRGDVNLEAVTVKAEQGTEINRRDAEVAFELTNDEIQAIPIEGRDITRVLYRLPNVSQATGFYPEAPNVSINGANSLFTSYLIDGMDNNERFLGGQKFAIPTGFTKDITVLTNNYSAEYGLTANGVIDITSKSGSNDFTGEAFFITRPGSFLDGESQFPQRDLSGNFIKQGFQRYQAGFGFGGPIVKDQTFYYFNVEHITDVKQNILSSPSLGINENVDGRNTFTYISGKIDHKWSNNLRSSLRVNQGLVNIENPGGGLQGGVTFPTAGFVQDRISTLVALKNSYTTDNMSMQTNIQYSRFNWDYGEPLSDEDNPQVVILDPSGQTAAVVGHPGFVFDEIENTLQLQQKFNFYFGNHTLKVGGNIISSDFELFGGGNANGNYLVQLNELQLQNLRQSGLGSSLDFDDLPSDVNVLTYNAELRPSSFGRRQTNYSFYVEDQWKASDWLNLTMGLRYDYDDLSVGGGDEGDYNNFGPRINANIKLTDQSVIRAGYGIFYDKVLYAIYSDALQQNTTGSDYIQQLIELRNRGILPADTDIDNITFNGNLTATFTNVDYLEAPTAEELQEQRNVIFSGERRILNPNGYQNPYTHQFSLGYQLQLDNERLFFVDLMHNRSFNLFRLRNLNAPSSFNYDVDPDELEVRSMEEADLLRDIPILFDEDEGRNYALIDGERYYGAARNIVMTESAGESRYYAASFNFQKSIGDDDWAFRINYTLSQLRNNTEDINFRAMDANDFEAEWGPSINDRTHIFNTIFSYYPVEDLSFTVASIIQSGQPINRVPDAEEFGGTADLNGDGASFGDAYVGNSDRYPGESRNNDRLPWATTFDVAVDYKIPLGNNRLELRADIFNLFNAKNLSGYANNATQSNQIQQGSRASGLLVRRNAAPPRQVQLSIRYLW